MKLIGVYRFKQIYVMLEKHDSICSVCRTYIPGVEVTKAPFNNYPIRNFYFAKIPLLSSGLLSYLMGVTVIELQWHWSNINVIFNKQPVFDKGKKSGKNLLLLSVTLFLFSIYWFSNLYPRSVWVTSHIPSCWIQWPDIPDSLMDFICRLTMQQSIHTYIGY